MENARGMDYAVYRITAGSYFDPSNASHGEVRLVLPESLRSVDHNGTEADVVTLGGPNLSLHGDLSWPFEYDLGNLETAPLTLVPLGQMTVSPDAFEMTDSCLRYADNNNPLSSTRPAPVNYNVGDSNDGYLRATFHDIPLRKEQTRITTDGVAGVFRSSDAVSWIGSYPYGFNVSASNPSLTISESQIVKGSVGGGTITLRYRRGITGAQQSQVNINFESLSIDPGGALVGDVTQMAGSDGIAWRSFVVEPGDWEFYAGSVTTPGVPISENGVIMWDARPGDEMDIGLAEPALREPGLNRRRDAEPFYWNCSDPAQFSARADTYLRRGGVTQRFQAVIEGAVDVSIHGYDSSVTNFDIYFLDNRDVDSNITGDLHLPFPADMTLNLVGMWLDPEGCVDGALLGNGTETLAYWDATIAPESVKFLKFDGEYDQPTPADQAKFDGWDAMLRLRGALDLPKLTDPATGRPAVADTDIDFRPDGDSENDILLTQDRINYALTGFPFLLETLRLSNYNDGAGESPNWDPSANADPTPAVLPSQNGFFQMQGALLAPYYGSLVDSGGDNPVLYIYNGFDYVGFARQLQAERVWADFDYPSLPSIEIKHVFDELVYADGPEIGLLVGFESYRFAPDAVIPPVPSSLQVVHLDAGLVIQPKALDIYAGLSRGVALFRALAE
ncbi:hypothetical protein KFU94_10960 [Chloroflexi bacterium TSY]|nr:hypothetical protein [Chloroflexi bacterium TSY]